MLQRFVDLTSVEAEIARVRLLSGDALRRRWQSVFGRPPPERLTADLLRRTESIGTGLSLDNGWLNSVGAG
jgi:hypothetical protein